MSLPADVLIRDFESDGLYDLDMFERDELTNKWAGWHHDPEKDAARFQAQLAALKDEHDAELARLGAEIARLNK